MPADEDALSLLERWLDGARWWGAELDARFRVAALTLEVASHVDVPALRRVDDRRLQLLLFPVGRIAARLRVSDRAAETFPVETLPDVVGELDGPAITAPLFGGADLEAPVSFEGSSSATDGWTHRLRVDAAAGDRALALFLTFDDVRLRTADGVEVELATV